MEKNKKVVPKEDITESPVEVTGKEVREAEERVLLSWVLSQILATELFNIAEPTIAKSASIAYHNKQQLAINTAQRKEADKFLQDIRRTALDYKNSVAKMTGYIQRSERYENVLKYAIDKMAQAGGDIITEALEKFPK